MDQNYGNYGFHHVQHISPEAAGMFAVIFGGFMLFFLVFLLIIYIFKAICLMEIARKTNTPNAWLAWIPIANIILMLQIAEKPVWWIVLALIPFVNLVWIVLAVIVWMAIAKKLEKPDWWGILTIIPIANLVAYGYLAFSNNNSQSTPEAPTPPPAEPTA